MFASLFYHKIKSKLIEHINLSSKWITHVMSFILKTTGRCSPYHMPHDIYFTYVERYYNDTEVRFYFDNKCNYEIPFQNVKSLEMFCLEK